MCHVAGMNERVRKLPVGAEVFGDGVHFRVWAPKCQHIELVLLEPDGYS
jgi:hypothetical protein